MRVGSTGEGGGEGGGGGAVPGGRAEPSRQRKGRRRVEGMVGRMEGGSKKKRARASERADTVRSVCVCVCGRGGGTYVALQAASLAEKAAARQPLQMRNGEDEEGKEESEEGKEVEERSRRVNKREVGGHAHFPAG